MVADKIDMSLDDIISSNKRGRGGRGRGGRGGRGFSNSRGRGGSGSGGGGAMRRGGRGGSSRGANRSAPYTRQRTVPDKWEHDMFDGAGGRGNSGGGTRRTEGLSTGSHLQISNLDFGVTESDIKELFAEFGKLKKTMINYDESGRSHGTADVVFERKADAHKAFNTYNGVPLDGRPMKIEAVTGTVASASFQSPARRDNNFRGNSNNRNNQSFRGNNVRNKNFTRGGRGGVGRGRGRGRGGRGRREVPSKDDLDKELDSYIESVDS